MFDEKWQKLLEDDLDILSEIINPVQEKTLKLEDGENRIVSILFLDIKGFTAMSEKLHHEKVKQIIDRIFKVFTNVILKYGGYIDKYEGDLIMALFGSKKTSETDTERAILSGLEILNKLKHINEIFKPQNRELSLRIGINTGYVTTGKVGLGREGDFTVYGDAVNLASRMESNAFLNSIMIPVNTKKLVEDNFTFTALGCIRVKGKKEPIEVFNVIGVAPQKIERWERTKLIKKSDYVGREIEFKQITKLFEKSQKQIGKIDKTYKPIVIGLRGSARLGKSRFIFEFIQRIKKKYELKNDAKIIVKGFTKSYAQAPYTLFSTLLKNYIGIADNDSKQNIKNKFEQAITDICKYLSNEEIQVINTIKPILGFLLGLIYDDVRIKNADPKILQTEILLSLRYFLEAVAKIANIQKLPLIVILEDLHWIDEVSLNAIKSILTTLNVEEIRTNRPCKNMFFLLSYRNEFKNISEFEISTLFTEFILQPLTNINSDKLIQSMLGDIEIPEKISKKLLKKSQGNPFYIEEWIHSLIDNNVIQLIRNQWQIKKDFTDIPIPSTLNNLILSRIDNMEERLKSLLQKASVIGNSFLQSILKAIEIKLGNERIFQQELSELISMDWLIKEKELKNSDAEYLFKHIITCDVAYKTILNYNRKILHKLIAEFAEERFGTRKDYFAFLANHYEKAEISDKAIEYLKKAGDFARRNYENEKANKIYDKLLGNLQGLPNQVDLRIDTLLKKGHILNNIGKWNEAEDDYRKALKLSEEIEDKKKIAKSHDSIGYLLRLQGDYKKALDCFEKELIICEELGDKRGVSLTFRGIGIVYREQGDFKKAMEFYKKGLKLSEELGDKRDISYVLGSIGGLYLEQKHIEKALHNYKKVLKIREEFEDKENIAFTIINMGIVYYAQGNYKKAMEYYEKSLNFFESIGNKFLISFIIGKMGRIYGEQGDYKKAMDYHLRQLKMSEELGAKSEIATSVWDIGNVYFDQGNYSKALEFYENALSIAKEIKAKWRLPYYFSDISSTLYKLKKYEEA
ncbi:MAG: tetratricopeptide repeat protein, partial [Candidatus Cloacimonetes bacterium]|nr:tetratricopeptide repeat protein [Candidatus Cloacimonadota bacterium]